MARLSRKRLGRAILAALALFAVGVSTCLAETILDERFVDNPFVAGRASVDGDAGRFAHRPSALLAHYDTALATTKLSWPLGQSFSQSTDFSYSFEFTLRGDTLAASPDAFAQLSFGLTNSITTGNDRVGGNGGDAFDVVTVDYFPNVSPVFGGPSLGPSLIETNRGGNFFDHLQFPFGAESQLDDEGELPLPTDVRLTAHVTYAAQDKRLTLQMLGPGGLLPINEIGGRFGEVGGEDGDVTTIELFMPQAVRFSVDSASILLWQDTFAPPGESTVRADLDFHAIRVFDEIVLPSWGRPPSDLTGDGWVDFDDLTLLLAHWNEMVAAGEGNLVDPTGSLVNFQDLTLLLAQWTGPGPSPAPELVADRAAEQVPEPASGVLAMVALIALLATSARRVQRERDSKRRSAVRQ
ncbi:MAG: hypothetical protein IIA67_10420 [Planctomycetes bacterium]|nr:hypothetical protein [Planctomycetota bacterium]